MTKLLTFILGFAICGYLTNKMLTKKARDGERPVLDADGSIYWKKDEEA